MLPSLIVCSEGPYFVQHLSEGSSLYAYVDFSTQLANVFPVALMIYMRRPRKRSINDQQAASADDTQSLPIPHFISALLVLSVCTAVALLSGWDVTSGAGSHSIVLLCCAFSSGIVGTTSWLLFLHFAATFAPVVGQSGVASVSVGQSVTGLLCALLAWLQGVGGGSDLRFSVSSFFAITLVIQLLGAAAFVWLLRLRDRGLQAQPDDSPHAHDEQKAATNNVTDLLVPRNGLSDNEPAPTERNCSAQRLAQSIVAVSCTLHFFLPGVLPFMLQGPSDASDHRSRLFWLTTSWNVGTIIGRSITLLDRCRQLASESAVSMLVFVLQFGVTIYAVCVAVGARDVVSACVWCMSDPMFV